MAFRDENEALRARIDTLEAQLEAQLEDREIERAPQQPERARLPGSSPFAKGVVRHSLVREGQVSKAGLDEIRQLLWAKVGVAKERKDDEPPPGNVVLTHARGKRRVRVVEVGRRTHLSIDHRRYGTVKTVLAVLVFAALLAGGMLGVGVHEDWVQMTMGIYALVVVLLGPLALIRSVSQEAKSVEILKDVAELASKRFAGVRARVAPEEKREVEREIVVQGRRYTKSAN